MSNSTISPLQSRLYPYSKHTEVTENKTLGDRVWRYIGGRGSCLARLPIYIGLGMGGQAVKIAFKAALLPFVAVYGLVTNNKVPECMTWRGIAKDSLILLHFAGKAMHSALGILRAPPQEYHSLGEAFINTVELVIIGEYHNSGKHHIDPASKLKDVFSYVNHEFFMDLHSFFSLKTYASAHKAC